MFPQTDLVFCKEDKSPDLTLFPALTSVKKKQKERKEKEGAKLERVEFVAGLIFGVLHGKSLFLAADPERFPHPLALLRSLTYPGASAGMRI